MMFSIKSNILQTKNTDILTLPFIMKLIHRAMGMNKIIPMRCKHIGFKGFCKNIGKVIFSEHIIQLNQAILQCFSCVIIKDFNLLSSLVYMGYFCNSHHGFRIRLEQERSFVWDAQLRENVINKFQFTGCFSKSMVFRFTTEPTNLRRFLGTPGNGGTICKNSKTVR